MDLPVPRIPRSVTLAAGLLAAALVAAACSSSSNHDSTDRSLPTAAPTLPANLPQTNTTLARLMAHGLTVTGSAHLDITATGHGVTVHGAGGAALVNGLLTGFDVSGDIGDLHKVRVVKVNSVTYAHLAKPAQAKRPWAPVAHTGGSVSIRTARKGISVLEQLGTPANILSIVAAGRAALRGTGRVDGLAAAHYEVTTRVAAIPRTAPIRGQLDTEHVRSVHLDLWVDGNGRPLSVRDTPTPAKAASGTVRFGAYNHPVAVKAPAASLVAHGG
jgi:hypothetical protein